MRKVFFLALLVSYCAGAEPGCYVTSVSDNATVKDLQGSTHQLTGIDKTPHLLECDELTVLTGSVMVRYSSNGQWREIEMPGSNAPVSDNSFVSKFSNGFKMFRDKLLKVAAGDVGNRSGESGRGASIGIDGFPYGDVLPPEKGWNFSALNKKQTSLGSLSLRTESDGQLVVEIQPDEQGQYILAAKLLRPGVTYTWEIAGKIKNRFYVITLDKAKAVYDEISRSLDNSASEGLKRNAAEIIYYDHNLSFDADQLLYHKE